MDDAHALKDVVTIDQVISSARAMIDPGAYEWGAAGAGQGVTAARNSLALNRLALVPRVLRDVSAVDTTSSFLGVPLAIPVLLAPVAALGLYHPGGALAAAQAAPVRITTATFVAPGGTVAERWKDGHAAAALRGGKWDAIVLQERGGLLACMVDAEQRTQGGCRASERAHKQFATLAGERGARTLLLATWGPDEAWQLKLDRAIRQLASRTSAEVVPAGSVLRAYAAQHPQTPTFPDKVHPNLPATLIMAAQLYRAITGADAQARDVTLDFPLLPANALIKADAPMEGQPQLAGNGKRIVVKADAIAMLLEASKP